MEMNYRHVRSPLETRRKMLEMNLKTAELKRAFYEFFLAKNGDHPDSIQIGDSLWSVVEAVLEVAEKNNTLLEDSSLLFVNAFGCLVSLKNFVPDDRLE